MAGCDQYLRESPPRAGFFVCGGQGLCRYLCRVVSTLHRDVLLRTRKGRPAARSGEDSMSLFNRDKISLLKQDGSRIDGILGTVASSDLIVFSVHQSNLANPVRVDPNDLLIRSTSIGDETFKVIDPRFYEQGVARRGAHYQCQVKKLGIPEAQAAVLHITYNVSGVNARVNVNSTDNSTNIANIDSQATLHIDVLREEIQKAGLSAEQLQEALDIVDVVKQQFESGKPKKSVVTALLESIPTVAKAATAVSGLIALL